MEGEEGQGRRGLESGVHAQVSNPLSSTARDLWIRKHPGLWQLGLFL